jgi:hypothetical protein
VAQEGECMMVRGFCLSLGESLSVELEISKFLLFSQRRFSDGKENPVCVSDGIWLTFARQMVKVRVSVCVLLSHAFENKRSCFLSIAAM